MRDACVHAVDVAAPVRVAVHAGEATETEGDYLGTTVNRAARLRGITEGGEVVVSAAAAALSRDDLPIDVELRDLGPVRLRDLRRDEQAFVLVGGGLPDPADVRRGQARADLLDERGVTPRERDVFDAISERLTNAEIAARFTVSERTIESHVSSLLRKLDANNRVELAELAKEVRAEGPAALPAMLQVATRRSGCFGRDQERAALLEHWRRAAAGEAGLAVVTGEAGMGKSRLVADLASEVHDRGGRVLLGAATDGAGLAYQPFVEALEPVVAAATESQLRTDAGLHAPDLARLLPSVGARLTIDPPETGFDPLGERQRLHAAIQAYLAAAARRQPTLLVLEDVHWASSLVRETLLYLARTSGQAPLLIVATTRDTAPELDDALTGWLAEAARLPVCEIVELAGLDTEATEQLMADVGSDIDVVAAHEATDGNPLFLREMATGDGVSATLSDFLANRFERLDEGDLGVLDTAAVVGESFTVDLVARAVDRPVDGVMEALDRAEEAGLVQPLTTAPPRFAFVHALFRDIRVAGFGAGRLLRLHAAVAE
ncbi:MAG: AAA family ATPase, partial [Actinomycetota bacterium]